MKNLSVDLCGGNSELGSESSEPITQTQGESAMSDNVKSLSTSETNVDNSGVDGKDWAANGLE